ncbi:MAG: aminomethyl-transferring glycine dehydrogenase subunit GcvPB [Spirochaetia bacterium]
MSKLIFEKSVPGRRGYTLPELTEKEAGYNLRLPKQMLRDDAPELPEVSELDVVRHFTNLSKKNFGVDSNFYPLGSCTMKYNPAINEKIAALDGFSTLHPLLPQLKHGGMLTQGALEVLYEAGSFLCKVVGMDEFTMQPLAGAHGELTGAMIIAAYHRDKGNKKTKVLIPDSGHGTNPATAAAAGYDVVTIPSGSDGCMDFDATVEALDEEVAAIMLTSPNTLGLFNTKLREISEKAREVDALMYYDGANLNALLGKCRPGDLGFDVVHINLHKTFATPHGGGGPGSGPVGVKEHLRPFLPTSIVTKRTDGTYSLEYSREKTIGYIAPFYGNFLVVLKAYAYMLMLGKEGLNSVSDNAVLNANYVQEKLKHLYNLPFDRHCMHECVLSAEKQADNGVHALDIAKALLDHGIHAPTVYFPLIVKEAMMIEPTETESKETLDRFIEVMTSLAKQAEEDPKGFALYPATTPVHRLDETQAARHPDIAYKG